MSFFSALLVRSSSKSLFFISRGLFGSILGLQDDPPTLENRAPASAAARFLKNQRFRSEDGLESALGLTWARFGCFGWSSWERFGWSWALIGSSRWLPNCCKSDSGALLGFFLSSSLPFLSLLNPLAASKWFFIFFWGIIFSSWSFSMSILSSHDDPSFQPPITAQGSAAGA